VEIQNGLHIRRGHLETIWAVVAVLANNKLWNHTYYHWIV